MECLTAHPRVSVIIPAYNCGRYICEAVESVLVSNSGLWEVIVIDDGSTDETPTLLTPFLDRIRFVRQSNRGVSAARNRGLDMAKGEFVVFLDADDYLLHGKISAQLAAFDALPGLGIVHSGWRYVSEAGDPLGDRTPWLEHRELDLKTWLLWKPVFLGAMMLRRDEVIRAGGFDTSLKQAEDLDLVLRMCLNGCQCAWLHDTTVCYRQHEGNTVRNGLQQARDLSRVIGEFFKQPRLSRKMKEIEKSVQYYTLIWIVWQLYATEYTEHIGGYLRRAQSYSPYAPDEKLSALHLTTHLFSHLRSAGLAAEEVRFFWPALQRQSSSDESEWQQILHALDWWLNVWRHYLCHDRIGSVQSLWTYTRLSVHEIVERTAAAIFVSRESDKEMISCFWSDATRAGLISPRNEHMATVLYLALFAEAFFGRRWQKTFSSLVRALKVGHKPRAWGIWLRFFCKGCQHLGRTLQGKMTECQRQI